MEQFGVVIVAAGKGNRMRLTQSKQYLPLRGKPILIHTVEVFASMIEMSEMVIVVGASDVDYCKQLIEPGQFGDRIRVVAGGADRQGSVYEGLKAISTDWVLIHDGVRPFVTADDIRRCLASAVKHGAAVLAVPVKDTVKLVNESLAIEQTLPRESLWAVQTPQAFRREQIWEAHEQARAEAFLGTDDASLAERMGLPVHIVQGDYRNLKITTPEDLMWAEAILEERELAAD